MATPSLIADVLLQNAETHGAGAVTLAVRRVGNALALEVSDQGSGFGNDIETAFARGSGAGHGIGLALARSLAHAEGARLLVTRPGPHPTVSLLLTPAAPATQATTNTTAAGDQRAISGRRVGGAG